MQESGDTAVGLPRAPMGSEGLPAGLGGPAAAGACRETRGALGLEEGAVNGGGANGGATSGAGEVAGAGFGAGRRRRGQ